MSKLRPECVNAKGAAIPDDTALYMIATSVERRKKLAYGRLDDDSGGHCAMGAFWEDNPKAIVNTRIVDEVAAVNDSVPPTGTPKERWMIVRRWLRWKLRVLATKATA